MNIYTATSWKNEKFVLEFARTLRSWGHDVYCFAELGQGQNVFIWSEVITPDDDGITCLDTDDSRRAYYVDKKNLDWSECVILILPCGRDAHLEAGYGKGQGKLLFILGDWPKGEYSNMYHLADGLFRIDRAGFNYLRERLYHGQ